MEYNKKTARALFAALMALGFALAPLSAQEAQHPSDYVRELLSNEFLLENQRLLELAEKSYEDGFYGDAAEQALMAIRYAELSDEYVARRLITGIAEIAVRAAEAHLEWAQGMQAQDRYPDEYGQAQIALAAAQAAFARESWDEATEMARRVLAILGDIYPALPSQFLVRRWDATRDSLWNIAAKPEVYGDPWKWPILYEANLSIMPRRGDPDLIHPGMILTIPSIDGEFRYGVLIQN